jgi:hypothetical protein
MNHAETEPVNNDSRLLIDFKPRVAFEESCPEACYRQAMNPVLAKWPLWKHHFDLNLEPYQPYHSVVDHYMDYRYVPYE